MIYQNTYFRFSLVLIILSLLISSCREDIISPDNPSGNINEPVRLKSNTSYTFILSANDISTTIQDYTGLNSTHSVLIITLINYVQGNAALNIYQYSKQLIFQKMMTDNVDQLSVRFDNVNPYILKYEFTNFTGELKIQVSTH